MNKIEIFLKKLMESVKKFLNFQKICKTLWKILIDFGNNIEI